MATWPSSSTFHDPQRARLYGLWLGLFLVADPNPFGCGTGPSTGSCPNDLPASCGTAPSYQATVAPILNAHCLTCHSPGGQQSSLPLQTYSEVYSNRSAVLNQVYSCNMPLAPNPRPSEEERQALLMWLVCGAPQN